MSENKPETKLETAEMHNAELTGKIVFPPPVPLGVKLHVAGIPTDLKDLPEGVLPDEPVAEVFEKLTAATGWKGESPIKANLTKTVYQVPVAGIPETGVDIHVPAHVGVNIELVQAEAKDPIQGLPQVKQYPVVPAPAPQVPPAEVGEAVTAPSGQTNLIAMGDSIKSGDYIKLDEPVESLAQGVTLDENSRAAFEKAVSMFNNPPPTGAVSYGKFEDFKAEVLRAFKHLGLDTRKHFTE